MNLLSLLEQLKQEISIKNLVNLALFYLEHDEIYCQLGSKFAENLISEHSQEISAYLIEPDLDIELEELADYPEWVNPDSPLAFPRKPEGLSNLRPLDYFGYLPLYPLLQGGIPDLSHGAFEGV